MTATFVEPALSPTPRRLRVSQKQTVDNHMIDHGEDADRDYVSKLWAEDWDCPEDSIYDKM